MAMLCYQRLVIHLGKGQSKRLPAFMQTRSKWATLREPWQKVYAKRQVLNDARLAASVGFFSFTLAYAYYYDFFDPSCTPKCLNATESKATAAGEIVDEDEIPERKVKKEVRRNPNGVPDSVPYLIIGGGTAAFAAYRSIKSRDPKAKILIVTEENRPPYMRPPLSKELWFSETATFSGGDVKYKQWSGRQRSLSYEPLAFYADPAALEFNDKGGIGLLKGHKVVKLDPDERAAILDDGRKVIYGKCLIATGGKPKKLAQFDKIEAEKITHFRNVDDFLRLNENVEKGDVKSVAVIGGGFLGCELANGIASKGKKAGGLRVVQVLPEKGPLAKVLPDYLTSWSLNKMKSDGIKLIPNTSIVSANMSKDGKVEMVTSNSGIIITDHVIVAAGIEPETSLAAEAGLEVDAERGGFVVNAELEASRRNIWVAGDAASYYNGRFGRQHVEHHDHAIATGQLAGENMTGGQKAFKHRSMFWSDIGPEIALEAVGQIDPTLDTVGVFTEGTGYDKGVVFYNDKNQVVVGILMWNVFNQMPVAKRVLKESRKFDDLVDVARLFDLYDKAGDEGEAVTT